MEGADRDWVFTLLLVLAAIAGVVFVASRWRDLAHEVEELPSPLESVER